MASPELEGLAQYIGEQRVRNVVVMCGAGISTSAGIPDFRTPGSGLYDNLQKYNLPRAESIFTLKYFRKNPHAFYELCKEMWPGKFEATHGHYFIRLLHDKGILRRCFTQNIDSLERVAGIPDDKVVAAHGNFDSAHVIDTDESVGIDELKLALDRGEAGWRQLQADKGGLVKPRIVFFGEGLPDRFCQLAGEDLPQCDLLIVLGTSLVVQPFAGLVGEASLDAPRLLINRDRAGEDLAGGFRFEKTKPCRDMFHQGDIDSGCRTLAGALGWSEELEALIDSKGLASISKAPWA